MEFRVKGIAKEAERLYNENYCATTCDTLSYHACSAFKPELECSTFYPEVVRCNETRRMVGLKTTNVLNPSSKTISNRTKYSNLDDPLIKRDVCAYIGLFDIFLENARENFTKWIYFGSSNGVYRGLPYKDMCNIYDARLRPWFIAGSTGPKNLIIVIDLSESMSSNMINSKKTRLEVVIDAYTDMIESLTESDWVGLVTFNGKAIAHNETLQKATPSFKESLIKQFKQLKADGESNFEDAFKKVFQMFKKSAKENMMNKGCINIISFISDGPTSTGLGWDGIGEPLLELIRTLNEEVGAIIFTLTIGKDNSDTIPKQIACLGNGIWSKLGEDDNLRDIFLGYYQVLASTLTIDHAIWSEIYEDASGLGQIISVVYPAYDYNQTPPLFLGVASMDLQVSEFDNYADKDRSFQVMRAKSQKCSSKKIDKCQMEALRGPNQKCNIECTQSTTKICTDDIIGPIFYKPEQIHKNLPYIENPCCGNKSTQPSDSGTVKNNGTSSTSNSSSNTTVVNSEPSDNGTVIIDPGKDDTETLSIEGIIGVTIGCLIIVIVVALLICRKCKQHQEEIARQRQDPKYDIPPLQVMNTETIVQQEESQQNQKQWFEQQPLQKSEEQKIQG